MSLKLIASVIAIPLLLAGCAGAGPIYTRPNTTEQQFTQDKAACTLQAKMAGDGVVWPWDTKTCMISKGYVEASR